MKERKKHTDGCNRRHGFMKVMCHAVEEPELVDLAILQDQGQVLNAQDHEVARDTEGHLCEHGMNVCMPEDEPASEGLPDVNTEHPLSRCIAYDPNDHRIIDDILKRLPER
jgi:hypothetical protein